MTKFKNYTSEQIEFIKANYIKKTRQELADELGKSIGSIGTVVNKLGLVKQKHKPWTEEEKKYLQENNKTKTSAEIARELDRTIVSVNAMKDRLGLYRFDPWTDTEVEYLINNFKFKTHAEIGKVLKRTEQAVRAKCFDLDLYKQEPPWTEEDLDFIKHNYMEMNTADIAQLLNRTKNAVKLKAERMGLKKYPYTCDYRYFDKIDTEEKAYWLGFLTADGWINKNEKNNAGVTGVELQYGDIGHLKKFNKSIGGNYQITDRWRTCPISTKPEKKNHSCILRIFSLTMYNSLVKLGFTNNKSFDSYIPPVENKLIRHYMRGYFDGNGCFGFSNNNLKISFITASKHLADDIVKIVNQHRCRMLMESHVSTFGTTLYRPTINCLKDKIKFLDWIYKDCSIYLDRKYKKYLKVKENYRNEESLAV